MGRKILFAILTVTIFTGTYVHGQKVRKPKDPKDTTIIITPVDSVAIEAEYATKAAGIECCDIINILCNVNDGDIANNI